MSNVQAIINWFGQYKASNPFPVYGGQSAPSASHTRPNNGDAYQIGDIVGTDPATNLTFSNVLAKTGGAFVILSADLEIDVAAIPSGMANFRLHLYDADPTAIADNAAYNLPSGDRAKYLGYITLNAPVDLGDTLWSHTDGINFAGKLAAGSTTLYAMLETLAAYTPTASAVKTVKLTIAGV